MQKKNVFYIFSLAGLFIFDSIASDKKDFPGKMGFTQLKLNPRNDEPIATGQKIKEAKSRNDTLKVYVVPATAEERGPNNLYIQTIFNIKEENIVRVKNPQKGATDLGQRN